MRLLPSFHKYKNFIGKFAQKIAKNTIAFLWNLER